MRTTHPRSRRSHWAVLVLVGLALAGHALLYDYVVDDAFISFRYAENLVRGNGLVFNPGERVEGYTNFLWVLLIALGMRLGGDPVILSQGLGLLAAEALLIVVFLWPRDRRGFEGNLRLLAPALLCLSPPFALWSLGGLETCLFALLVFASMAGSVRGGCRPAGVGWDIGTGLLLGLAGLTRPEGILAGVVVVGDRILWPGARGRGPFGHFPLVAAWLAVILPHQIWRWTYYGFLLPNSFYAKVGMSGAQAARGLTYLGSFAAALAWLPLLLGALGLAEGVRDRPWRLLYLWAGLYSVYVVVVGGDGLGMYRFWVPALPAFYLLAERGVSVLEKRMPSRSLVSRRWAGALLLVALGLLTVRPTIASPEKEFVERDRVFVEKHWAAIGKWLRWYAKPGESIAVTTAGAVPYYSALYTIDMLGINEPAIAHRRMAGMGEGLAGHEKHDMDYVLRRRPTYLFHHLFLLTRPKFTREQFVTPWNPGEEDLVGNETFTELYEPVSEEVGPFYINFFRLRQPPDE